MPTATLYSACVDGLIYGENIYGQCGQAESRCITSEDPRLEPFSYFMKGGKLKATIEYEQNNRTTEGAYTTEVYADEVELLPWEGLQLNACSNPINQNMLWTANAATVRATFTTCNGIYPDESEGYVRVHGGLFDAACEPPAPTTGRCVEIYNDRLIEFYLPKIKVAYPQDPCCPEDNICFIQDDPSLCVLTGGKGGAQPAFCTNNCFCNPNFNFWPWWASVCFSVGHTITNNVCCFDVVKNNAPGYPPEGESVPYAENPYGLPMNSTSIGGWYWIEEGRCWAFYKAWNWSNPDYEKICTREDLDDNDPVCKWFDVYDDCCSRWVCLATPRALSEEEMAQYNAGTLQPDGFINGGTPVMSGCGCGLTVRDEQRELDGQMKYVHDPQPGCSCFGDYTETTIHKNHDLVASGYLFIMICLDGEDGGIDLNSCPQG